MTVYRVLEQHRGHTGRLLAWSYLWVAAHSRTEVNEVIWDLPMTTKSDGAQVYERSREAREDPSRLVAPTHCIVDRRIEVL